MATSPLAVQTMLHRRAPTDICETPQFGRGELTIRRAY
jgi:hypothetical protein